ncbi:isoprenyl transferase [Roseomonas sp. NAR14]|uniref:Isoprenyl transferase n=1 Tax=Roseomonas acroporae TaxID=2937791 RepID=A0A9X1Y6M3_9PROT|nr:isoprenyl transferase [Roseomonas acroporae]MCK8785164.1 isoprenyl transferase [Roseomonas acroporae]
MLAARPSVAVPAAEPGVPNHVAIIMDGNGRWAASRGLPRALGHKAGADAVRRAIEASAKAGVRWLTLFAFSSENWHRPADEVRDLTALLRFYLRAEVAALAREGVRLRVIGERSRFGPDIAQAIEAAEATTAHGKSLNLNVALSYGARAEIAAAARALAEEARAGRLDPATIDEATFGRFLFTADMPDPDLIIRTSGEQRLSNFLLWQAAYAEFVFLDVLWPDFGAADLEAAIGAYRRRERRYGARGA